MNMPKRDFRARAFFRLNPVDVRGLFFRWGMCVTSGYLSETFERREYHAPGCRISCHTVVRLAVAGDHPQLHALGDLELIFLGEQGPERLSPDCGTFREELADKGAFVLQVKKLARMGVRAESRCASDGQPGSNKPLTSSREGDAIVFDVVQRRHSPTSTAHYPLSLDQGRQSG